jgi:hypothetical protein
MIKIYKAVVLTTLLAAGLPSLAECVPGVYKDNKNQVVVVTDTIDSPSTGFKYLMLDGRFGTSQSTSKPFRCHPNFITLKDAGRTRLSSTSLIRAKTTFISAGTELTGELIEPAGVTNKARPLVVMLHGSEQSPAIGNSRALLLAGLGISVFVYDKRGTGQSSGIYCRPALSCQRCIFGWQFSCNLGRS